MVKVTVRVPVVIKHQVHNNIFQNTLFWWKQIDEQLAVKDASSFLRDLTQFSDKL